MNDASRRRFVKNAAGMAVAAASVTGRDAIPAEESSSDIVLASAFKGAHELRPLPFDAKILNGLSEKLIVSHWQNNYGGSVKALNAIKPQLAQALASKDTLPIVYDGLKREHLLRTGSVVLHEYYFGNLGANGQASGDIAEALTTNFGKLATWESEFRKIGPGLSGGSGWVVVGLQPLPKDRRKLLALGSRPFACSKRAPPGDGYVRALISD